MESMTQRMDTLNVRIMSSILSAHRDSGGHLAETLQRLAQVIRNRFDYQRKLRSITSAGRASLFIVTALAWGIFIYLFAFQPSYGREFFNDPSGRLMLIVAFGLELIGVCWGWALLRQQY
jgi:tight adherence protein B